MTVPKNNPKETVTERIAREAAEGAVKDYKRERSSPNIPAAAPHMDYERRLNQLEVFMSSTLEELSDGRTKFAIISKDIESLTKAVDKLQATISRVGWMIISAVIMSILGLVLAAPQLVSAMVTQAAQAARQEVINMKQSAPQPATVP